MTASGAVHVAGERPDHVARTNCAVGQTDPSWRGRGLIMSVRQTVIVTTAPNVVPA